jgi:hypothetical protein
MIFNFKVASVPDSAMDWDLDSAKHLVKGRETDPPSDLDSELDLESGSDSDSVSDVVSVSDSAQDSVLELEPLLEFQ